MVAKVSNATQCNGCQVKDNTAPPAPQIRVAIASSGLAKQGSQFVPNNPPAPPRVTRDPAYIEIGNWEPGTTFQVLNKSNDPTASFDKKGDALDFAPTGRDIDSRIASVWINDKEMEKLNIDPGDSLWIRAVDADGNTSPVVKFRLAGNGYGTQGRVREDLKTNNWVSASTMRLLDGEGAWKQNMILKHIADQKAPVVKHFEKDLRLETAENGQVTLKSEGTLEEGARVHVQNGRTGQQVNGVVDANQNLSIAAGNGIADGDTLFLTVSDVNGNAAGKFEVRYGAACKNGRGSTNGILGAKLGGVIKAPAASA